MEIAEFYVAANPPLSPSGAAEVYGKLQELELVSLNLASHSSIVLTLLQMHKGSIHDITYDPDAAWFCCLTEPSVKTKVHEYMETTIKEMGEDTHLRDNQDQTSSNDDVDTSATGWFTNGWPIDKDKYPESAYESLRFPRFSRFEEGQAEPAFKASWHGIEQNWPMTNKELFFGGNTLETQFNVQLSWNAKESIIYIASHHSMNDVLSTIAALDKMVQTEVRKA